MRGLLGFSVARVSFSALCNVEKNTKLIKIILVQSDRNGIHFFLYCLLFLRYLFLCMAHPKLRDEFCKDAKECFCGCGLAVFSKVRGHLGKLVHCFLLVRVQRLHSWMGVLKKALMAELSDQYTHMLPQYFLCSRPICT